MVTVERFRQHGFVSPRTRESQLLANLKDPGLAGGWDSLVRGLTGDLNVPGSQVANFSIWLSIA